MGLKGGLAQGEEAMGSIGILPEAVNPNQTLLLIIAKGPFLLASSVCYYLSKLAF